MTVGQAVGRLVEQGQDDHRLADHGEDEDGASLDGGELGESSRDGEEHARDEQVQSDERHGVEGSVPGGGDSAQGDDASDETERGSEDHFLWNGCHFGTFL